MKKVGKPVFFIVFGLIAFFTITAFFGISTQYGDYKVTYIKGGNDIRWGIDIRGGVEVTFTPPEGVDATKDQMEAAEEVIKQRLSALNITDNEVYTDYNKDRVIVRFPWKADEADFDPQAAIAEIGETALLTFREGKEMDQTTGAPSGVTAQKVILEGKDINKAYVTYDEQKKYAVGFELNSEGTGKFAEATARLAGNGYISIWMDNDMISAPAVSVVINEGKGTITGNFTYEDAAKMSRQINSGALPFKLQTKDFNTIDPILGMKARDAMLFAGGIAFFLIAIFLIWQYKLPGVVAMITVCGQVAFTIMAISGYFPVFPSFTLTLPGIAGIILGIGMGVDANIITAERIKEELHAGKSLDGSIQAGFQRGWAAIVDGNLTVVIVAVILMGAFGPPDSAFAVLLSPLFAFLGPATTGAIYSFGYTLLIGVLLNFVMGVFCSRMMIKSLSKFKSLRKLTLYGGEKE